MEKKNIKEALQGVTVEEKQRMSDAFIQYDTAKKTNGDVPTAYNKVRDVLKELEQKYDVTILTPNVPEEKLIDLMTESAMAKRAAKLAESVSPQPNSDAHYTCSFQSIEQANKWLVQQKDVAITHMQVETSRTALEVQKIRLEYRHQAQDGQRVYQLTELKKNRFFLQSKPEKVRDKWQKENPGLRYVASVKKNWGFSLLGGSVGYFRYIKEKYIILYIAKRN